MKTKQLLICFGLMVFCSSSLKAQTFYYSDTVQIPITETKSAAVFYYTSSVTSVSYSDSDSIVSLIKYDSYDSAVVVYLNAVWPGTLSGLTTYLGINNADLSGSSFSFTLDGDGARIFPSFNVIIKLNEGYNLSDIDSLLAQNGLSYFYTDYNMIVARSTNPQYSIDAANTLNNDYRIDWCSPDIMVELSSSLIPNDFLFQYQYYLNDLPNFDHDIDAAEAWDITTGNGTVTTAVIDMGVADHDEMHHPAKVLNGWSWDNAGFPLGSPVLGYEKHGQWVAGIIAATQNNVINGHVVGISGVCPNSRILPLRHPTDPLTHPATLAFHMARAINWAWQNGADIINCSWDLGDCNPFFYQPLRNSIQDAQTLGRGGLGCPVIFAAGNDAPSQPCVKFPANCPNVIAVSALTRSGGLASYSNHDSYLSVAAFGGGTPGDIYTTGLMGSGNTYGYGNVVGGNPNNYKNDESGTSMACPQVAGVAALLLSMDPTLTETEVRCRIRHTATDIGSFGFDTDFGWGRLNAYYCVAINNLDLIDSRIEGLQTYSTKNYITSGNGCRLFPTSNVSLTAGKAITLNPGFKTDLNCVFLAEINNTGPCGTNNSGPFRMANNSSTAHQEFSVSNDILIKVNPNPAQSDLFVSSLNNELIKQIIIKNTLGQQVTSINTDFTQSYLLDVSNYNPGIYFILVRTTNGQVVKKIIKN